MHLFVIAHKSGEFLGLKYMGLKHLWSGLFFSGWDDIFLHFSAKMSGKF